MQKRFNLTSRTQTSSPQGDNVAQFLSRKNIVSTPSLPDLSSPRSLKQVISPIPLKTKMMSDIATIKMTQEKAKTENIDLDLNKYKTNSNKEEFCDLMETLGVFKNRRSLKLPQNLNKLKAVVGENNKYFSLEESDRLELGLPVRRKDVHALAE